MSYKSIGKQLQLAREQAGYSQEQLAVKIGCSQSTLSNYEKGKRRIYLAQLENIAELLNKPIEFFLRPSDYLPSPQDAQKDNIEPGTSPRFVWPDAQTAGATQREGLQKINATEREMLETYRSLSDEGQKVVRDFVDWVKKREMAGNG